MANLLIVNYCMDLDNPVLSHQVEAVNSLARTFDSVTVVTGKVGRCHVEDNVEVLSTFWEVGKPFTNIRNFLRTVLPKLKKADVVFSHMTEVQSMLLSPFTKLGGTPHFLWYAHAHLSKYLFVNYFLTNGIITSTPGSCPIRGKRVYKIGQAIDSNKFYKPVSSINPLVKFCHVGRFDASKDILKIILVTSLIRNTGRALELTLVGAPSTQKQEEYASRVKMKSEFINKPKWITFTDSIRRDELPNFLSNQDVFVHAFKGSLDKTLIEATLSGLPVVTVNLEYIKIFGSWSMNKSSRIDLAEELKSLMAMDKVSLRKELMRRQSLAISEHSLVSWTTKLSQLLHNSLKSK